MFFKDTNISTNITAATPERVFALCQCVEEKKNVSDSSLRKMLEPDYAKNSNYYSAIRDAAIELDLIDYNDYISLKVEPDVIKNIEAMRNYINSNISNISHGAFYAITKTYFSLGEKIFGEIKNMSGAAAIISNVSNVTVNDVAMRAWRFWASFLGFGYLDSMLIIPNAAVFIKDLIDASSIKKKEYISMNDFFAEISPSISIIVDVNKRNLNYGATAGILTLEQLGILEMTEILDHDVWNIADIDIKRRPIITNIKVKK